MGFAFFMTQTKKKQSRKTSKKRTKLARQMDGMYSMWYEKKMLTRTAQYEKEKCDFCMGVGVRCISKDEEGSDEGSQEIDWTFFSCTKASCAGWGRRALRLIVVRRKGANTDYILCMSMMRSGALTDVDHPAGINDWWFDVRPSSSSLLRLSTMCESYCFSQLVTKLAHTHNHWGVRLDISIVFFRSNNDFP